MSLLKHDPVFLTLHFVGLTGNTWAFTISLLSGHIFGILFWGTLLSVMCWLSVRCYFLD